MRPYLLSLVHPKIKILSFTHPKVIPNTKEDILKKVNNQTVFIPIYIDWTKNKIEVDGIPNCMDLNFWWTIPLCKWKKNMSNISVISAIKNDFDTECIVDMLIH